MNLAKETPQMAIHEILLVPGAGHSDDEGKFTRGHTVPAYSEVDLVDRYVSYISDELDHAGVKFRVMNTRRAPGVKEAERFDGIFPNTLVIDCRIGFNSAQRVTMQSNVSCLYYGGLNGREVASDLADVMKQWGSLYVFGHKGGNPVPLDSEPLYKLHNSIGVRLEPFKINGPNVQDYARHLDKLGRDLGRSLVMAVKNRLPARAAQIYT